MSVHTIFFLYTMRRMMQSIVWQLEFNALLILLTFLTHEQQYFSVFGITVNPLDSIPTTAEEFDGDSEVHNNIDYDEYLNDPNDYLTSSEVVSCLKARETN